MHRSDCPLGSRHLVYFAHAMRWTLKVLVRAASNFDGTRFSTSLADIYDLPDHAEKLVESGTLTEKAPRICCGYRAFKNERT